MCIELAPGTASPARTATPAARAVAPAVAKYRTNLEVTSLVRRFEDGVLPREEWTHAAHLIVALDFARRSSPQDGLTRLRLAIKRHNKATGTPETETRGYHETITVAWFQLVRHFLEVFDDGRSLAALADALVELYSKETLFAHYSRERLLGREARARWVEPDLQPLPGLAPVAPYAAADAAWLEALDVRAAALPPNRRAPALAAS
jgi:hypothetical protein